jgi:hypothetical protein
MQQRPLRERLPAAEALLAQAEAFTGIGRANEKMFEFVTPL